RGAVRLASGEEHAGWLQRAVERMQHEPEDLERDDAEQRSSPGGSRLYLAPLSTRNVTGRAMPVGPETTPSMYVSPIVAAILTTRVTRCASKVRYRRPVDAGQAPP